MEDEGIEDSKWLQQEDEDRQLQKEVRYLSFIGAAVNSTQPARAERGSGHGRAGGVQEEMAGGTEARWLWWRQ